MVRWRNHLLDQDKSPQLESLMCLHVVLSDRLLVITTGTFSRDARMEATRDGAPPIDLVDNEQLIDKLKELGLGVKVEMKEDVTVLPSWFQQL